MGIVDRRATVRLQELIVSSLAQSDVLAKLLIEKGVMETEFYREGDAEVVYQLVPSLPSPCLVF